MGSLTISIILVIFSAVGLVKASVHVYSRDPFREVGNAYLISGGSEGIAASRNLTPLPRRAFTYIPHDGRSYIRFDNITFWRTEEAAEQQPEIAYNTGLVQVVIFEAADRDTIGGSPYGGQRSICCTSDLAKLEGCTEGEIIRTPSPNERGWPKVLNVQFKGNLLSTRMKSRAVYIKKTGMYNLFFISCDPKLKGMRVTGKTVWKNPDGYLPGRMAPLMKFYVIMSIAYAILSIIWFVQYVRHWNDVLLLQHCIAVVIGLGVFEMIFWYTDYAYFNNTGIRPSGITAFVVTIGAIRRTFSRLLILSVAMGYGVVRPTLGGLTTKVLLLGLTYFVATELLNITEYVGAINDKAGRARVFLVLPDAFVDAFLILWIFTSLSKTLEQLQAKRSSVKLDLYRKFSNALAVTVIVSVMWIGYEVFFKATDPFNEKWQGAWIITAFWDILALCLLSVICYLWAPSQSSQRYAYSEEKGGDSDDDETESLCRESPKGGDISLVKQERKEGTYISSEDDDSDED
ncbi:hypothetical protein Leryth_007170 [Lithospermum erythrorhizon]|nr:hypothetical protein Leryth_007170 [Lithospermum erythrorhizon]